MGSKTIVLISSAQPSANPRLLKEAFAYAEEGYSVKVVYCPLSTWADVYDAELFKKYSSINWICVGYHPSQQQALYLYSRFRQKIYQYLFYLGIRNPFIAIRSNSLFTQELIQAAKRIKADVYVGHNLGALPAVVAAASENCAPAIFDFEDFHRGESSENSVHWDKVKIVEDKYISRLHYATTASPLITEAYSKLYPFTTFSTINNCYPLDYLQPVRKNTYDGKLKLFWFSQFVGENRGLETIIDAIGHISNSNISLTLLGNCSEKLKDYFLTYANKKGLDENQLVFIPAVAEEIIASIAASHDIGLACEVPYIKNREFCLTNKIFMYLISGIAIIYSNTDAQYKFFNKYSQTGMLYDPFDAEGLAKILEFYLADKEILQQQKNETSYLAQQTMNWEVEQRKLLSLINNVI